MPVLTDFQGREVRLTDERLRHILNHKELADAYERIEETIRSPQTVVVSRSDSAVNLAYRFYAKTLVGGKYLCIVVKYAEEDAFVLTAYLTDKIKAGEVIWPKC
jgi:hypothetical protein